MDRPSRTPLAFALVALLAAFLRLPGLGLPALAPEEAPSAVIAWRLSRGEDPPPPSDPSWRGTSPLLASAQLAVFALLGGGDEAAARVPSGLAGIALALVPFLFRRRLGSVTVLVLAALLALDPTCVESSRRADGTALAGLVAALAFAAPKRSARAAAAMGLLLVSGPAAWTLLPVVVLASRLDLGAPRAPARAGGRVGIAAVAALLGASGMLGAWDLLGSVSTSLTVWLESWAGAGPGPVHRLGIGLPLPLGLALVGLVRLMRARRYPAVLAAATSILWTAAAAARPGGEPAAALLAVLLSTALSAPAVEWMRAGLGGLAAARSPRLAGAAALALVLAIPAALRTARIVSAGQDGVAWRSVAARLLEEDVARLSMQRVGDAHELAVDVLCQPSPDPLLRWALREVLQVRFHAGSLDPRNAGPSLVLEPAPPGEAPCEAPRARAGSRYTLGTRKVVLWVPREG